MHLKNLSFIWNLVSKNWLIDFSSTILILAVGNTYFVKLITLQRLTSKEFRGAVFLEQSVVVKSLQLPFTTTMPKQFVSWAKASSSIDSKKVFVFLLQTASFLLKTVGTGTHWNSEKDLIFFSHQCILARYDKTKTLAIELCSDSFHAVLALSCGQAECKCQLPRNLTFGPGYSVQIKDVTNEKKLMKTA